MEQKDLKMFLVCNIIAFEPRSTNSPNPEEATCHWQWMCYQATITVNITLREIFSKWGSIRVMKKQDESGLMKMFLVCKIIVFEAGWTNCHIVEQDTCHWQSICYPATLRFNMSLREVYSKPGSFRVMKNIKKVVSWRFYKSVGPFQILTVKGCY